MKPYVEPRVGKDTGFVYVDNTRMIYAPRYIVLHLPKPEDTESEPLVLTDSNWATPTRSQRNRAREALQAFFGVDRVVLSADD